MMTPRVFVCLCMFACRPSLFPPSLFCFPDMHFVLSTMLFLDLPALGRKTDKKW